MILQATNFGGLQAIAHRPSTWLAGWSSVCVAGSFADLTRSLQGNSLCRVLPDGPQMRHDASSSVSVPHAHKQRRLRR